MSVYKRPGILRASFDYQDLSAIEILIDFYRRPDLYEWAELDSDNREFASIDDIVVCRKDGRFEITQVKFTVDPADPSNRLDWDWLLQRSGRQRSLLQKWSETVSRHAQVGQLELAQLFTDRRPSEFFAKVLDGERVDVSALEPSVAKRIEEQLGSTAEVQTFFNHFRFRHSQPHMDDMEYRLRSRLMLSDTNEVGWLALARAVKKWATFRKQPEPDGRVRHSHIRAVLSPERPRPLPQNFDVPPGYEPPDAGFDETFRLQVLAADGTTIVWGPPGRGKSTYLSYCFQKLEMQKQICVRHHYFLKLGDRNTARFFYQDIERSLIRQIEEQLPNLNVAGSELTQWLDAAAKQAGESNRKLIVMLDGLDHVWREGRSLEHMTQLFAVLLPVREHMHLIVGTQKIANKYLPKPLLNYSDDKDWHELPLMSPEAIKHWLIVQANAGRLRLDPQADPPKELHTLAGAFYQVTGGLPLQLIYVLETLLRRGGTVTDKDVLTIPASPTGDIRDYYRSLWTGMSATARLILHSLASVDFAFPPNGLLQCFHRQPGAVEALEEIDHLLDHHETGSYPFHGSIFIFVRDQSGHDDRARVLRPDILAWLENNAPTYWRWAWTWITKAAFGDEQPLQQGPSRAWAKQALREGQPPEQIELILNEAETLAFRRLEFGRAAELRSLRIRLLNGPEFQTNSFDGFVEATLRRGSSDFRLVQLRNALGTEPPAVLLALLRSLDPGAAGRTAERVLDELNRRVRESRLEEQSNVDWPATIVRVLPYLKDINPKRLKRYANYQERSDALIGAAADEAIIAGKYDKALTFAGLHRGEQCDRALFAVLCLEDVDPAALTALRGHMANPLFHALYAAKGWPLPRRRISINVASFVPRKWDYEARALAPRQAHRFFYKVLSAALGKRGSRVKLVGLDEVEDEWFRQIYEAVARSAVSTAAAIDAGQLPPTLQDFYASFDFPVLSDRSYESQSLFNGIRLGLRDIGYDLQLLRRGANAAIRIAAEELPSEQERLWLDDLWLDSAVERRLPIHDPTAAAVILARIDAAMDSRVTQFMERLDLCIHASIFALDHQLDSWADRFLERAAGCLLSYGWRKDPYAFEVLEAVVLMATTSPYWADEQLSRLAPAFESITDYTDGDETNHARSEYYDSVVNLQADKAGSLYGALTRAVEWYYAERLLSHAIQSLNPTKPYDRALLATLIQPDELEAARKLEARNGQSGKALIATLHQKVGYSHPTAPRDRGSSPSYSQRAPRSAPRPAAYPPSQLAAYRSALAAAKGHGWKDRAIERWLRHWHAQGHTKEALQALRACDGESLAYGFDKTYDLAFTLSLEAEGRDAAFFWLVAAQRNRHGWQRFYTDAAEAERRLELAAAHYRERWSDFVLESSKPLIARPRERSSLVMGLSRLVRFLLAAGEHGRAQELSLALVDTMLAEVEEQPLPQPVWTQ